MNFQNVQSGQQVVLKAQRHNAVNELLRRSAGASFDRGLIAQPARTARPPDIGVKNVSGGSFEQFAVVEITGTAIAADTQGFRTAPVLEVDTPGEDAVALAVLAEPIAGMKTGSAWIHGHVTLQIDVTDEDHKYVDAKDGSTQFESGDGGYVIQWKESGTGIKWAVVNLSRQSGGGEPGSTIVLAQAPPSGIPKRSGFNMGIGSARLLGPASSGNSASQQLYLKNTITVHNPSLKIAGDKGDRLVWLSDNTNGAIVLGWDDPNNGDPSVFPIEAV